MKDALRRRLRNERSEAGETLIETLLTVMLIGLCIAGLLGALATMLFGTKAHRDQADANSELVQAMETIKAKGTARLCPAVNSGDGNKTPPAYALPPNVTFSTSNPVKYQVVGGSSYTWSDLESACDLSSPLTLQLITLTYTNADSDASPELSFVKGKY